MLFTQLMWRKCVLKGRQENEEKMKKIKLAREHIVKLKSLFFCKKFILVDS